MDATMVSGPAHSSRRASRSNPATGVRRVGDATTTSAAAPRASRTITASSRETSSVTLALVGVIRGKHRARDRLAVAADERRQPPHRVTPRRFDLDDVGTEIRQELRAVAADPPAQVEYPPPDARGHDPSPPSPVGRVSRHRHRRPLVSDLAKPAPRPRGRDDRSGASVMRDLVEGNVTVDRRLPRQPEHALTHVVPLDLVGPSGDRHPPGVEELIGPVAPARVSGCPT